MLHGLDVGLTHPDAPPLVHRQQHAGARAVSDRLDVEASLMPTYAYRCTCGYATTKTFKSLPSEARQTSAACDECNGTMARDFGEERFYANGGQHSGMEKAVQFSLQKDSAGRPIYRDQNGQVKEIRTSSDIDAWQKNNAVGLPRMTEVYNPVTGRKQVVAQRERMVLDPQTGEVDEAKSGAIIRTPERLVPLDGGDEVAPPSESITGIPIVNGAMQRPAKRSLGFIDPETRKPATTDDVWGAPAGSVKTSDVAPVRRPPPGTKWK